MVTKHRLWGLSAGMRGTFRDKNEDHFWADFTMSKDRYNALFNWAKTGDSFFGSQNIICSIQSEKLNSDGVPINGKIIEIEIKQPQ